MFDVTNILDGLNDRQREAVIARPGPLLVTAGAGSGKTSVLTRRIAWLVQAEHVSRHRIMAVTFTNKAAREMKVRVEGLLGQNSAPSQIGTFHGLSNRFLRIHSQEAGLDNRFEIMDSNDQKSFIGRLMNNAQIPVGNIKPADVQSFINKCKERGLRASAAQPADFQENILVQFYEIYEKECEIRGLVDFAELLLRTVEVLQRNQLVREESQDRYSHVLVDEFQDTNALQYEWLKLFCAKYRNITAVGDEDQSIYGWRGALAENMLEFESHFSGTRVIHLEQNYRSTQHILHAANAVISNNLKRYEKKLWTDRQGGSLIHLLNAEDSDYEAEFVADIISHGALHEMNYSDYAVLYRTNAQSRIFEQVFSARQIPFRVYGGVRFFARQEIKDVLAYLRMLVDSNNNEAWLRTINIPPRGIGNVAQQRIADYAAKHGISLWEATNRFPDDPSTPARYGNLLKRYTEVIDALRHERQNLQLYEIISLIIDMSGMRGYHEQRATEIDRGRLENLDEMIAAGENFSRNAIVEEGADEITAFLDQVTLDAGDRHEGESGNQVQIMTLHSAKGLEFPVVFLTGLDEQLLPHELSRHANETLEEERRLCYVGMTRAQEQLYLTRANRRNIRGEWLTFRGSRFLAEIPAKYIEGYDVSDEFGCAESNNHAQPDVEIGNQVYHQKFGQGVVTDLDANTQRPLVQVQFESMGSKWLVWDLANLQVM